MAITTSNAGSNPIIDMLNQQGAIRAYAGLSKDETIRTSSAELAAFIERFDKQGADGGKVRHLISDKGLTLITKGNYADIDGNQIDVPFQVHAAVDAFLRSGGVNELNPPIEMVIYPQ